VVRPKAVRIAGLRVTVVYGDLVTETGEGDGAYLSRQGTIAVNRDMGADQERETFFHEVLHACIDQTNLRSTDSEKEEKVVSALSPVLFGFIRDNPRAVAYLQETA
jgi:Zn-dependent peptidase ImmA (M78 family)